ncbi:predicted protein [Naegleria gruberi]|uniref:Phospholipid-transporting ATPase n=1 Tax=Naegleria gruberi TaxID=5762 RepID=D2VHW9_NAEGR|nr:uncharacterized protein NAEGRDRAFT_68473 [Naegleria gruberi]EFC43747.1 predicted protein [Naegleria gruberi]|eukprot:XP_002676491.1 predicted protein [Naegleria gruberi strain NEG-M]
MVVGLNYTEFNNNRQHLLESSTTTTTTTTIDLHYHKDRVSTPSGGSSSDRELLDSFSNRSSVGLLDPLHLDDHPYYYQQQSPHQSSNILKSPSSAGQPHQDDKNNNIIILQSPNSNMPTSATSSLPGSNCNNSFKLSEQHDNNNTIEEEDEGSILKSTQFVYGTVIYTGSDTKIMKNMQKGKVKFSFVNAMLNYAVGILFTIQIACCLLFAGLGGYYEFTQAKTKATYTGQPTPIGISDTGFVISSFLTYFILLSLMIPVSLFVSLEFVKMIQAWFITMDNKMAIYEQDPHDSDKKIFLNSLSISSDLNADLSQVDIIFSDKTGTLTENSMVFKKCCISYDYIHDDFTCKGQLGSILDKLRDYHTKKKHTAHELTQNELDSIISERKLSFTNEMEFFQAFNTLLLLSLCHNVSVREKIVKNRKKSKKENQTEQLKTIFEGESIDEVALVLGAQNNGFLVKCYSEKKTILEIFGKEYHFERLAEIPFTADRKRMSTIFLFPNEFLNDYPIYRKMANFAIPNMETNNGIYVCFTKGADSFLFPFIKSTENEKDRKQLEQHILNFAIDGLRTLLLAFKFIEPIEFNTWLTKYNSSKSIMSSRRRKQAIEECEFELESNLNIVGATGIEDCLQPNVPETIKFLLDAGLQLWLLTGDKRETAINIAQMSNFLSKESKIYSLNGEDGTIHDEVSCSKYISHYIQEIVNLTIDSSKIDIALILDGHSFTFCMENEKTSNLFIELVKKCQTVICCRATPKQKSQLVDLAKKKLGKNGLAIGDGANDVPMIQKAKIGVGIMGKEGSQAKLASDYAIPKFYMLKRLLVTHGRYSYKRSAQFIQYSFYKNIVISFVQIFYAFYTMSSGQTIADSYVLTFYNLVFTLLNPFVFGLFEKDVNEDLLEDPEIGPKLYAQLRTDYIFNWFTFIKWILGGIIHATIIFYFAIYGNNSSSLLTDGRDDGLWSLSTLICSSVFIVVNLKCYFEMENITIIHHLCMILSFITYYGFQFAYAGIEFISTSANFTYYVWYVVVQSPKFWIVHLLCVVTPLAFDFIFYGIKYWIFPDYYQQLKMSEKYQKNTTSYSSPSNSGNSIDDSETVISRIPSEKSMLMEI